MRATLTGAALICALALTGAGPAVAANRIVIEGTVSRGGEFARDFGAGFTFRLRGRDVGSRPRSAPPGGAQGD